MEMRVVVRSTARAESFGVRYIFSEKYILGALFGTNKNLNTSLHWRS